MEGVAAGNRSADSYQPFRDRVVRIFAVGEVGVLAALFVIVLFFFLKFPFLKKIFNQPVFQRMKRNNGHATTWFHYGRGLLQ